MGEHALLSASGSQMWLPCAGSIQANKGKVDTGSEFAAEGTLAHDVAYSCLVNNINPLEYKDSVLPEGMADSVATYVEYVRSINGLHAYEIKVDFSQWVPDGFGTVDALIVDGEFIHVVDKKYGKGVKVYAKDNSQGMLYGLGAYSEVEMLQKIKTIKIHIVQPRLDHIDTWEISVERLLEWAEWVKVRAELAMQPNAPRTPGEKQCRWCKAVPTCNALFEYTSKIVAKEFNDLTDTEPGELSESRKHDILKAAPLIRKFLSAVEDHVYEKLSNGESFPGYKLVHGRSTRKWSDETEAEKILVEALGEDAFEKSLLSPTKAEKALGKQRSELISNVINKPKGKPTMVPDGDKRKAIAEETAEEFEDLNCKP